MKRLSSDPKLPLVIGIAGHRYLPKGEELKKIESTIEKIFRALSSKPVSKNDELAQIRGDLGFPKAMITNGVPVETPIWLVSSMAIGADILCAVKANEYYSEEEKEREIRFIAPLSTPWIYRLAAEDEEEAKQISRFNQYTESFHKLRLAEGCEAPEGGGSKLADNYEEFVLPLGGRGILQHQTVFPEDKPYLTLDEKDADEIKSWVRPESDDESETPDREAHFRASAHYVALYSHILIAVWDGQLRGEDSVGTDASVRAKISGPSTRQISEIGLFNWADAGPVLQVYAANKNSGAESIVEAARLPNSLQKSDTGNTQPDAGDWSVIHPDDCDLTDSSGKTRDEQGKDLFKHLMESMTRLNNESIQDTEDDYFLPKVPPQNSSDPIGADQERFSAIWSKASRISAFSAKLKSEAEASFSILFLFVAIAAVLFDVYAHWFAGFAHGAPLHHPNLLYAFIFTIISSVFLYRWFLQRSAVESRFLEYRAIAEGARVQLSWMMSGIPQSVPLHYLQRHRGAFDYIRDTISAWCFPYENGQRWFDKLPSNEQIKRLQYVVANWVRDQEGYFQKNAKFQSSVHHLLHTLGIATALVGVSAATFLAATGLDSPIPGGKGAVIGAWIFGGGFAFGFVALVLYLWGSHHSHSRFSHQVDRREILKTVVSLLKVIGLSAAIAAPPLTGWFLPKSSEIAPYHPREWWPSELAEFIVGFFFVSITLFAIFRFALSPKLAAKTMPFFPFAFCAVTFSLLTCATIHSSTRASETAQPDSHHSEAISPRNVETSPPSASPPAVHTDNEKKQFPYILVIGLPLLFGALLVAWGEKMLYSETANQFRSSHELFRLTGKRLDRILKKASEAEEEGDEQTCKEQIGIAQTALYQLGKEALSENAEWLILHRTRPLEFPMAG